MAAGMVPLLVFAGRPAQLVANIVYGLSVIFLFSASSLYHAKKTEENEVSFWRKLDHSAIFFMIAGTYTAICTMYLDRPASWIIVSLQWAIVLAGIFFRFFWLDAPRVLYTVIYLMMGWIAVFVIRDLYRSLPLNAFAYLLSGGLAYTAGAVFYMLKRPKAVFGFHEIFHLFILLGAAFHYLVVLTGLTG
jgi:hemolysin III